MAGSLSPLSLGYSHGLALPLFSPRSPGALGVNDAADPTVLDVLGDTPGPLGIADLAAELQEPLPGATLATTPADATTVTMQQLGQIVSAAAASATLNLVNNAMELAQVNTPARMAAFLSQVAEETMGLTRFTEIGSDAYFTKSYDPGTGPGKNVGNTIVGDGPLFRGRGLLQLTGRENYTRAWIALNLPVNKDPKNLKLYKGQEPVDPTLAADAAYMAQIAGWYWTTLRPHTNRAADQLEHSKDEHAAFVAVTRAVNGGVNGLKERIEYYKKAKHALNLTWGTLHLDLTPHHAKKKKVKKVARRKH